MVEAKKVTTKKAVVKPVAVAKAEVAEKPEVIAEEEIKVDQKKYWEAVGRRKTAVARVRLFAARPLETEEGRIQVNGKSYKEYFPIWKLQWTVEDSLRKLKSLNRFEVMAKVNGGGINAQAEAIRHGIARSLVVFNADFRKKLKRAGFLKRDPREKERRKPGLKKARKSPQWSKR